jgi:hypothetical protein
VARAVVMRAPLAIRIWACGRRVNDQEPPMSNQHLNLAPDTEQWLRQQVAEGTHADQASAIDELVAERRLAELAIDTDDHMWAKPAIDEALASLASGQGAPLQAVAARLKARVAASADK